MGTNTGHYTVGISRTVLASQYDPRRTPYQSDEADQNCDKCCGTDCGQI